MDQATLLALLSSAALSSNSVSTNTIIWDPTH